PDEYSAIIFTSKNSIDHFFRICDEMRVKMSQDTKYFCLSEAIANYLQKFIVYRKRKVFAGKRTIADLKNQMNKHKAKEKFLMPVSNLGAKRTTDYLNEHEFDWKDALMYRTVCSDLSDLSDVTYDVLVFFSPLGINSLYENFPDFKQKATRIAVYGNSTKKSVLEHGLDINIMAPAPDVPSMTMALEKYLKVSNKK
ncbi:MAG: uroporphyrinogen-III synthase, partial [Saprospiraceae bacterium]|nr:uroporphyrinogen-III synthase [Saprospiraceae bacterium]